MKTVDYCQERRFQPVMCAIQMTVHIVALIGAVPFFSKEGLVAFCVLYTLTGIGITLGYHRLFTHRSYETSSAMRYGLAIFGMLAGQNPPTWWVAVHNLHHAETDGESDPHTPSFLGLFWSHMKWTWYDLDAGPRMDAFKRQYAPRLCEDRVLQLLERYYIHLQLISLVTLFGIGALLGGWWMGVSLMVWGGFVRMVVGLNFTWFVNSAAHCWGYKNYVSDDSSGNLWWVAWVSFGEGWHANHHASPKTAFHGFHRWWEIDPTYMIMKTLSWVGLVWNLHTKVSAKPLSA